MPFLSFLVLVGWFSGDHTTQFCSGVTPVYAQGIYTVSGLEPWASYIQAEHSVTEPPPGSNSVNLTNTDSHVSQRLAITCFSP